MSEQTQPQSSSQSQTLIHNLLHLSTSAQELTPISQTNSLPSKLPSRPGKHRKIVDNSVPCNEFISLKNTASAQRHEKGSRSAKLVQRRPLVVVAAPIVARSLSCQGEVENAIFHLRNSDPLLSSLIDIHPPPTFDCFHTPFLALARSILYQQLAFKAGTSIYTRFIRLCGGEPGVVSETVLALTQQELRQIGVSGRKASYLHDLARKYQNGILSDATIVAMDDKSLYTMLTMVNGIGSWSVHMFMIFSLHRPDVLPINDLGIRKGVQLLYNLPDLPRPSQMDQLCEKWRPYRSVASWYLWRFVESKGTPSSVVAVATGVNAMEQQQILEEHQHHQEPQLLDPINGILDIGACTWEQ